MGAAAAVFSCGQLTDSQLLGGIFCQGFIAEDHLDVAGCKVGN